jgi:hypothetical protein
MRLKADMLCELVGVGWVQSEHEDDVLNAAGVNNA